MDAYEQLNASFGQFAQDTLTASTKALRATDETTLQLDRGLDHVPDRASATRSSRQIRAALERGGLQRHRDQRLAGGRAGRLRRTRLISPGSGAGGQRLSTSTSEGSSSRHAPGSSPSSVSPA